VLVERLVVEECLLEITELDGDEVDAMIDTELTRSSRTLTVQQRMVRAV